MLLFQATKMTHVPEGRLKVTVKEANKKKALKQVAGSTLNKKVNELTTAK